MAEYHIAQFNIARMRAPLDDPSMADFVTQLGPVNTAADEGPGFVWRMQSEAGNTTDIRLYGDEPMLVNMSVWESIEALRDYVYRSAHLGPMQDRKRWFEKLDQPSYVLWWIPAGEIPTSEEGKARLDYLWEHGESACGFTFKKLFEPPLP